MSITSGNKIKPTKMTITVTIENTANRQRRLFGKQART